MSVQAFEMHIGNTQLLSGYVIQMNLDDLDHGESQSTGKMSNTCKFELQGWMVKLIDGWLYLI